MVAKVVIILFLFAKLCSGVIYQLNESEYEQMPPLFGMDSNYRSCLREPGGVYCVAKFELHGDPRNELLRIIREYSQHEIKHYNHSLIDRAVCVTKSCKKYTVNKSLNEITDLNMALEGCINETIWTEYGLEAKLAHIFSCDKYGDQLSVDLSDWVLAGILISFVAINLIGSLYDIWYFKTDIETSKLCGNPYLLSFSIFRNWKKLTNTNVDLKYERLAGIHGIKSITIFFVVLSHVMWVNVSGFTDNPRDFEMSHDKLQYQIIFSGMAIVQIFFIISGCLLTFHLQMLSETKTLTWNDALKILFLRWFRLSIANAVVIFFSATWLRHLGSGPFWKLFVLPIVTDCETYWKNHLFYYNNYIPQDKYCAAQTWHLATEMQLFTVGLIVFMATASRGRYLAIGMLGLVGLIAPALHVWLQDLDALVMHKPEFYRTFDDDTYRSMHVLGHNNLCCHAIGMAVGLFSYYCVKNNIEYTNNKVLKLITWCAPLGIIGLFLSGIMFYVDGDRPHVIIRTVYAAVQRPVVGVLIAVLLMNIVMKVENFFRRILEWRGWMITSRLCYSVYLLHFQPLHVLLGVRTQLGHVSFFHVVVNHFGVVFLTLMASVPFYLVLEAPFMALLRAYIEASSETKQKKIN